MWWFRLTRKGRAKAALTGAAGLLGLFFGLSAAAQSLQALQADEALNPGMLWVSAGQALWQQAPGANAARSCQQCHGDLGLAMRGVATRYPRFSPAAAKVVTLAEQVQACHVQRQQGQPWLREDERLLQLEAALAHASKGMALAPDGHPQTLAAVEQGRAWFVQRLGQLDMSCAQCHDDRAGHRLGGSLIPQGDPAGYPVYRLAWQTVGSLRRRLRGCLVGVRAEPFAHDDPAWVALEAYLMRRSAGQRMDAPAIRP